MPGQRKSMTGKVVSDKMDKTVVVAVESTTRHRLYHKILRRTKRYLAHDDRLDAKPGDLVRILETRPLSRNKRWRVAEILRRGEVAEIAPREIDSEYFGTKREKKVAAPEAAAATTDTAPEAAAATTDTAPEAAAATIEAPAPDADAATTEAP
ncbi:MAG: 30S ribosomal protein S17, partial [Chloroflexi bacterium]|nr:30S ribosomal protein S17 [Chloroflexota bacterium]